MKLRQCTKCKAPISLQNQIREFVCPKCGLQQSATNVDLRARVGLVRTMAQKPVPRPAQLDFGRASFSKVAAPRQQRCACDCGEMIEKGQEVFSRPLMMRGRPAGETRIVDLEDHYDRWFEETAHKYVAKAATKVKGLSAYLGET